MRLLYEKFISLFVEQLKDSRSAKLCIFKKRKFDTSRISPTGFWIISTYLRGLRSWIPTRFVLTKSAILETLRMVLLIYDEVQRSEIEPTAYQHSSRGTIELNSWSLGLIWEGPSNSGFNFSIFHGNCTPNKPRIISQPKFDIDRGFSVMKK